MKRYIPQKGDICRWPYQQMNYAQEYDGQQWSKPTDLKDLASADPEMYARVMLLDKEPERYELVHRKKRHRKTYYREKSQIVAHDVNRAQESDSESVPTI
jgi:hypothetical protein